MATTTRDLERGAAVQHRTSARQKHLVQEYGVTPSVVSRWRERKHSPFVKDLVTARRLARNKRLNPWPLIVEAIAVMVEERYAGWTTEELVRRACELYDAEHGHEAEENRAGSVRLGGGCREAHRRALLDESAIQIELAGIDYVLEERGADWARNAIRFVQQLKGGTA